MKTRTFIAIGIDDQLRAGARLAIERMRGVAPSFSWVAEENLHYTLHFLGDLTDTEVVQVCERVAAAVASCEPFTLAARRVGAFPSHDRPRTLWIGAGEGEQQVIDLYDDIGQALDDLGFRGENRRFVPHMTLGKLSRQGRGSLPGLGDELSTLADFDAGTMRVDEVTVFASELRSAGPEYLVLARAPLTG